MATSNWMNEGPMAKRAIVELEDVKAHNRRLAWHQLQAAEFEHEREVHQHLAGIESCEQAVADLRAELDEAMSQLQSARVALHNVKHQHECKVKPLRKAIIDDAPQCVLSLDSELDELERDVRRMQPRSFVVQQRIHNMRMADGFSETAGDDWSDIRQRLDAIRAARKALEQLKVNCVEDTSARIEAIRQSIPQIPMMAH